MSKESYTSFVSGSSTSQRLNECQNLGTAPEGFSDAKKKLWRDMFTPSARGCFAEFCITIQLRKCQNEACRLAAKRLQDMAPECPWSDLRDWAITVVACLTNNRAFLADEPPYLYLHQKLKAAFDVFAHSQYCVTESTWSSPHNDAFGVFEISRWVSCTNLSWGHDYVVLSNRVAAKVPAIVQAMGKLERNVGPKICRRRLWNLLNESKGRLFDLPSLLSMLQRFPNDYHKKHGDCVPDTCHLDDDNTTRVEQQHKCGTHGSECVSTIEPKFLEFEPRILNGALKNETTELDLAVLKPTAWPLEDTKTLLSLQPLPNMPTDNLPCYDYMAVSHVWADGTGRGSHPIGTVNKCLWSFFVFWAKSPDIDCKGIWWDTICMPTEQKQRELALEKMHLNYRYAKHTLIHDEGLVNFQWKEDGSPCVALALSTWFTRGWTALELMESRSVKVLFGNGPGGYVLKDLDNDILATEDNWPYHHLSHRMASMAIMKLRRWPKTRYYRQTNDNPLNKIQSILRTRYTSWSKDRLIIACLMAGMPEFRSSWNKTRMSQSLVLGSAVQYATVSWSAIVHGQTTMREMGPWSWCPVSALELTGYKNWPQEEVYNACQVLKDGSLRNMWRSLPLKDKYAKITRSENANASIKLRLEIARLHPEKYLLLTPVPLLLRPDSNPEKDEYPCLLVKNLGVSNRVFDDCEKKFRQKKFRHCQYIGTVFAELEFLGIPDMVCIGCKEEESWLENDISRRAMNWGGWSDLHIAAFRKDKVKIEEILNQEKVGEDLRNQLSEWGQNAAYYFVEGRYPHQDRERNPNNRE